MIDLSFDVGIIFVISWYHSLNFFIFILAKTLRQLYPTTRS